jgi:hypothetical protein
VAWNPAYKPTDVEGDGCFALSYRPHPHQAIAIHYGFTTPPCDNRSITAGEASERQLIIDSWRLIIIRRPTPLPPSQEGAGGNHAAHRKHQGTVVVSASCVPLSVCRAGTVRLPLPFIINYQLSIINCRSGFLRHRHRLMECLNMGMNRFPAP